MDAQRRRAAEPFEGIFLRVRAVFAQHGAGPAVQPRRDLGHARIAAAPLGPQQHDAVAVDQLDRRQAWWSAWSRRSARSARRPVARRDRAAACAVAPAGVRQAPASCAGRSSKARAESRSRRCRRGRARPQRLRRRDQRRALRDQLGLGLADQRVLVHAQEQRADPGQRGREQQRAEQDRPQPQRRPAPLDRLP